MDTKGKNITQKASTFTAGGDVNVDSAESITVTGSDIAAGVGGQGEPDATGDINLTARDGDVTINESVDSLASIRQEVHAIAEVSAVVEHKSVEIVKALQALKKSKEKLQQAKRDYRQYKKDRSRIQAELAGLEQDYANKVPGVSYDDLTELRALSEDLESDKDWYIAGIALAATDVATKGTALAHQVDAASESTVTWGFDAGLQLDIEGSKSKRSRQTSTANASTVSGDNITINTGLSTEEGQSKTTIRGSHLAANDTITINTGELNAEASQSTARAHNSKESFSTSISQTLHGAATGGVAVSGSYSRSKDDQKSTTYENSTITADQITLNSRGDTTVNGANIRGNETLDINVGGDLQVESKQNRRSGSNKSLGIEAGFSTGGTAGSEGYAQSAGEFANRVADTASAPGKHLGGDAAGSLSAVNGGLNAGSGRFSNKQTVGSSLTGGEVNVDVAGHTQLNGAVIAATDENGADTGNLELSTQTFGFEDLTNRSTSTQRSAGITAGVNVAGQGDTTFDSAGAEYANTSGNRKSKTLATLGSGDITIRDDQDNGTDSTERLNRDVTNTGKSLVDIQRQQGNFDVTITKELLDGGIPKIVGDYAERQVQAAEALVALADQEKDPEQAQALRDQAQAINDDWGETGTFRVALHTITGALTGDLRGAATALATAYTIPELSNKLQGIDGLDTKSRERILTLVAGTVGAVGGGAIGAADSVNQTVNNYLKHDQVSTYVDELQGCMGEGECREAVRQQTIQLIEENEAKLASCSSIEECSQYRAERDLGLLAYQQLEKTLSTQELVDAYALVDRIHGNFPELTKEQAVRLALNEGQMTEWQASLVRGGEALSAVIGLKGVGNTQTPGKRIDSGKGNGDNDLGAEKAIPAIGKTVSDNEYFTSIKEYQASENGTGYKYKVFRQDIDADLYVSSVGKTNRQLMRDGRAPYVILNGKTISIELHHSRQNAEGPLFELSSSSHKVKTGQGAEALHPYKTKRGRELNGKGSGPNNSAHPDNPVDRVKFNKDRVQYWQDRIREIDGED